MQHGNLNEPGKPGDENEGADAVAAVVLVLVATAAAILWLLNA